VRQCLGQQRLAATSGPDEKDVALLQFHVLMLVFAVQHALVVIVNRHGERALGALLPDDITAQGIKDLARRGDILPAQRVLLLALCARVQNLLAQINTAVADMDAIWPGDQSAARPFGLPAERTPGTLHGLAHSFLASRA